MRCAIRTGVVLVIATSAASASATTYQVGPGQTYPTITSVVSVVRAGDTVSIAAGTFREAVLWTAAGTATQPITIQGAGSNLTIVDGTGVPVTGNGTTPSALFEIQGAYYNVQGIGFQNATNGSNGAGIRVLNAAGFTNLLDVYVHNCDVGISSSGQDALYILGSEVASNGVGSPLGLVPNLDLGGTSVSVQSSYIHDAITGPNVLARAHYVEILYSFVTRGNDGEISFLDSLDTASTNANAVMIGDLVVGLLRSAAVNSKFIEFGQDQSGIRNGGLYAVNNTLVATNTWIVIADLSSQSGTTAVLSNNVLAGTDSVVNNVGSTVSGSNNWMHSTAPVPSGLTASIQSADPGFADPDAGNFFPTATSPLVDQGAASVTFVDGTGTAQSATPALEYQGVAQSMPRPVVGPLDIGAFEFAGADGGVSADAGSPDGGASADSGASVDAGGSSTTPPGMNGNNATSPPPSNCGCGSSDGVSVAAALWIFGIGLSRRRRV